MSLCVLVQLSFPCSSVSGLKKVASETMQDQVFLEDRNSESGVHSYTYLMLKNIEDKPEQYVQSGNKGDLFMWGGEWNYYDPDIEIELLKVFFKNLWKYKSNEDHGIIAEWENALLTTCFEQHISSCIYEISFNENTEEVVVRSAEMNLNWNH